MGIKTQSLQQHYPIKFNALQFMLEMIIFRISINLFVYKKGYGMNYGLRSLLEPKKVQFLKKKLELGEISQKECKEIMKRLILQKYDSIQNRSFRATILGFGRSPESKLTT